MEMKKEAFEKELDKFVKEGESEGQVFEEAPEEAIPDLPENAAAR